MLHKSFTRVAAIAAVVTTVLVQCPVRAEDMAQAAQAALDASAPRQMAADDEPILIAQACSTCGAEIGADAVLGGIVETKKKNELLLTDSLWGNLILEMAYQRDQQLGKLARRMGLVNFGTMGSISLIAGGTLAQGIVALTSLNPPPGIQDSYVPGGIGVGLSSATILTFVARMYFGHAVQKAVRDRQLAIKHNVEHILHHLELANGNCTEAQKQLKEIIGERATGEFLQLWKSSHQLAMTQQPKISLDTSAEPQVATSSLQSKVQAVANTPSKVASEPVNLISEPAADSSGGAKLASELAQTATVVTSDAAPSRSALTRVISEPAPRRAAGLAPSHASSSSAESKVAANANKVALFKSALACLESSVNPNGTLESVQPTSVLGAQLTAEVRRSTPDMVP